MGTTQIVTCDRCGGTEDVDVLTIVYKFKRGRPWEVDVCNTCYGEMFADVSRARRRATINNVRPQHRVHKTEIDESNL